MATIKWLAGVAFSSFCFVVPVAAQQGPVAQACAVEMEKFCAGTPHGQGQMRACLTTHKDKASAACQQALSTTGTGIGGGMGMGGMGGTNPNR